MDKSNAKPKISFFERLATFIVDKRNLFFLIYIAGMIFCLFSSGWVSVNDDLTSYLPEEAETRQGLRIMDEEFTTLGTSSFMISNITYEQAENIAKEMEQVEGVASVAFDNTTEHYKNSSALFSVTFEGEATDEITLSAFYALQDMLAPYDLSVSGEVGVDESASLDQEMQMILVIAAFVIIAVLLFTSRTYAEIPVLLVTFVAAAILNKGTNFIFGEISFISDSVTVVLQLALAIDYAIILCHRFSEERKEHAPREACIRALSKAIPEISASSLTTISGLAALMFMQFQIGFDMGMVLIKAILFSLLSVFTLMPGLLMLFSKWIDKTHHRNFVPKITGWGKVVTKLKYVVTPLFACILVGAFWFSSKCPYVYGYTQLDTVKHSEAQLAQQKIDETFGTSNVMAVMVPAGDYEKEGQLLNELETYEQVDYAMGLANVEAMDGYVLTDKLTPRQFSELTDLDIEVGRLLYTAYAAEGENYGPIISDIDSYGVPLIDMFQFLYSRIEEGYLTMDDELMDSLDSLYKQLTDAKKQLQGEHYSRLLVNLTLPEEGEETSAFLDTAHQVVGKYYDAGSFYIAGNSTSDYELSSSFERDNVVISVLSILFVIIVLLFTFQSVGLPILLILVIQGSVWINFSFPYLQSSPLFFMSYLIVSSIQMGANIDYAIVISSRYQELKQMMPPREAMIQTLNLAFPTILTSGTILASAGIIISQLTSECAIYGIGECLGRGTIISMLLVLGVLPGILLLGDTIIERTSFSMKHPSWVRSASGKVHLDGRVRGQIAGRIDAEIHGTLYGDVTAAVSVDTIREEKEQAEGIETTLESEVDSHDKTNQ